MAELSPTAAAVLNAANSASAYSPDDCLNESRWIAAAALRAAASRTENLPVPFSYTGESYRTYDNGLLAAAAHLRAIAAELEGITP